MHLINPAITTLHSILQMTCRSARSCSSSGGLNITRSISRAAAIAIGVMTATASARGAMAAVSSKVWSGVGVRGLGFFVTSRSPVRAPISSGYCGSGSGTRARSAIGGGEAVDDTGNRPPRPPAQRRPPRPRRDASAPPQPSGAVPELPPLEANGFLAVFKPQDWTSNDVVQKIRGVLEREARRRAGRKVSIKVGHGGTLDPLATGVLVIGVGTACRDLGAFLKGSKGYRAVALLGSEYDTMDRTGQVTETVDISHLTPQVLAEALPQFRGAILQKPPAFSAIKKGGKRLYELARQGESVEVEARPVQVDRLELLMEDEDGRPLEWPYFGLVVECGGGTYVRSLISDLARAAGARAHMTALCRTKQGPFLLEHCLEEAKWRTDPEAIVAHLVQSSG